MGHPALAIEDNREGQRGKPVAEGLANVHRLVGADQRRIIQVELFRELSDFIGLIDGDAYNLQSFRTKFALGPNEFGHLFPTRAAPCRPVVDDEDLAPPLAQRLRRAVRVWKR